MGKDRTVVFDIITEMLNNPDSNLPRYPTIYPTGKACEKVEAHIEKRVYETLGWAYAYYCVEYEKGVRIPSIEVPDMKIAYEKDFK